MTDGEERHVSLSSCDTWDEVPGALEQKPESVVRITFSSLGGGSRDIFLAPGDALSEGFGTSAVEVEVFEQDQEDG